jgi:predicted RNA-binding protein (virulence factor B family)
MVVGESYVVHLHLDEHSGRIMGSSKLDKYLLKESHYHKAGQAVDLQIFAKTDLGYKAVIGSTYQGLLYNNEIFQEVNVGDKFKGFISGVRGDKRIDLSLQALSQETRGDLANQILVFLAEQGGSTTLTDKSSPEDIQKQFKVSKKSYKKALGALYKRRQILIELDKISLTTESTDKH